MLLSVLLLPVSLLGIAQLFAEKSQTLWDFRGLAFLSGILGLGLSAVGFVGGMWTFRSLAKGFMLTAAGWGIPALVVLALPFRSSSHDALPIALFWGTPLAVFSGYSLIRMLGMLGPKPIRRRGVSPLS